MTKTDDWLQELGLSEYKDVFANNDLDWESLPDLENADLKEIGIKSLGHRKKLLRAITLLAVQSSELLVAAPSTSASTATSESERRQVTVMFCDLVGSTALSTHLDAEDMDAVIRKYQEAVTPVVREYGGHIARFAGDGILSYFGYPQALEHEPERAIRAALKAVRIVEKASFHKGVNSKVRIGIATGDVVVGGLFEEGKLYEAMATGETPNLAARLQGVAEPGGIVVCEATWKLAGELFSYVDQGVQNLRGFRDEVPAWCVTGSVETEDRFHAKHARAELSPLKGRENEYELIKGYWQSATQSRGVSVLVSGDAGVGKSRLFKTLTEDIAESECVRVSLFCEPYNQNTPFYALANFVYRAAGLTPEDPPETKSAQLRKFVEANNDNAQAILPFIARLIDLDEASNDPLLSGLSPQRLKEETVEACIALTLNQSQSIPVLMFVDDLHWADPSTLQFLDALSTRIAQTPILLFMTARSDAKLDWKNTVTRNVEVAKLGNQHILNIIDRVCGETPLPAKVRKQILEKSDGIPLFAEELTKSVVEEIKDSKGQTKVEFEYRDLSVPNALANSLMARLDRLKGVKEFALLCSVIGREFSPEMVSLVSGKTLPVTQTSLNTLVEAELITSLPNRGSPGFVFRHALLRDAAYNNLLRSQRKQIHLKIAETLEIHYPQTVLNEPERMAHHETGAENFPAAIQYWLKAGTKALQGGTNLEAADHLRQGLDLLENIEDEGVRLGFELPLQMTLAPALIAVQGFASPEVELCFSRARTLCEIMGSSEQQFPVLRGLMAFYIVRSEFQAALNIGKELQQILEDTDNVGHRLELAWNLGSAKIFHGLLHEAMVHFEEAVPLYDKDQHAIHAFIYGQDPGVATLTHHALGLTLMGKYDEAREVEQKLLSLAEELNHPFTRAQAWGFVQTCLSLRYEFKDCLALSEKNIVYCEEQRFPVFMGHSMIAKGLSVALAGDPAGIEVLENGFKVYFGSGALAFKPSYLLNVAMAHLVCGEVETGLAAINESATQMDEKHENLFRPLLFVIKAQLLLRRDGSAQLQAAEELFRQCIELARANGTRHFELLATLGFVDACQVLDGDSSKALALLKEVYAGFDQGFDIPPMVRARQLLQQAGI